MGIKEEQRGLNGNSWNLELIYISRFAKFGLSLR